MVFVRGRYDTDLSGCDAFDHVRYGAFLGSESFPFDPGTDFRGTIVSAGYGFICGAYMPISQFSEGIQTFISFLPGTYGTALLHSHLMRGTYEAMEDVLPAQAVDGLRGAFDSDLVFQGHTVTEPEMYLVLGGAVVILIGVYVALGKMKRA